MCVCFGLNDGVWMDNWCVGEGEKVICLMGVKWSFERKVGVVGGEIRIGGQRGGGSVDGYVGEDVWWY